MLKTIRKQYRLACPIKNAWQALVDPNLINKWGGGPAVMDDKVGTLFKLWGGDIWGTNMIVEAPNKLVQEWFAGDWARPSVVSISLREENQETIVELVHTEVPEDEADAIDEGWDRYYFGEIKKLLEK